MLPFSAVKNILSKITELAQDPDEASDGHAIEHGFRIFSASLFVKLRLPQAVLVPHLDPHQRHSLSLSLSIYLFRALYEGHKWLNESNE